MLEMNEHQRRLWSRMTDLTQDFHEGRKQFGALVSELAGAFEAAEFRDPALVSRWYEVWTPLEIRSAVQGDAVDLSMARGELAKLEELLTLHSE